MEARAWFCVSEWASSALDTVPFQRANLLRSFPTTCGNGSLTGAAGVKAASVTTAETSLQSFPRWRSGLQEALRCWQENFGRSSSPTRVCGQLRSPGHRGVGGHCVPLSKPSPWQPRRCPARGSDLSSCLPLRLRLVGFHDVSKRDVWGNPHDFLDDFFPKHLRNPLNQNLERLEIAPCMPKERKLGNLEEASSHWE